MESQTQLNLLSADMVIWCTAVLLLCGPLALFIAHAERFEAEYAALNTKQVRWLTWPAIALNYVFERYFGDRGQGIAALFTWRSVGATLLISLMANLACVYLILTFFPADFPPLEPALIRIFALSYLVFILFNFLGDLVSVAVTRHVVARIAVGRCNFLHYIVVDIGGIIFGYVITLLPTLFVVSYALATRTPLNPWIETGLLGSALIPFFLFIFATTHMPFAFTVFAVVAVLSVTIPTAIYILLMLMSYIVYRVLSRVTHARILGPVGVVLDGLVGLAKLGLYIAPVIAAYALIF